MARLRPWLPLCVLLLVLPLLFPGALPGPRVVSADDHLSVHALFQDASGGGRVAHPQLSDPALQFKALQRRTVAALSAGQAPLWNPDLFLGAPLLADGQSMPGSPVTWLRLLLPENLAQDAGVAFILIWTGLGAALLCAALGAGPWGAATAGIAAMLAPYPVVWLLHPHAATACWLPWVLLALERRKPEALALAVAGMAGGGHPGTLVHGLALATVWAGLRARHPGSVLGILFGLLLAAPLLLPLAELAAGSSTAQARVTLPLDPRQLLDLLWPGWLGHPARAGYEGPGAWADGQLHPGLVCLALAGLALASRRDRWLVLLWVGALILSLLPLPGPFNHGRLGSEAGLLLALAAGLQASRLATDRGRAWGPLLACGVLLSGQHARRSDQHSLPAQAHDPPLAPWVAELRQAAGCGEASGCDRVLGLSWALQPNTGALAGLRDLRGYDLPVSQQTRLLLRALEPRPQGPWYPVTDPPPLGLLRLTGVGLLLTLPERSLDLDEIPLVDAPLRAWRVPDPAPRAWLAPGARPAKDAQEALTQVKADPEAWMRPPVEGLAPPTAPSGLPAAALQAEMDGPGLVFIAIPENARGVAVFNESWSPGWRADVAGEPRPLLRVGGLLMGVAVQPGDRRLRLRYRPDGWIWGQRLGLVGLVGLLGLRLWRRRPSSSPRG